MKNIYVFQNGVRNAWLCKNIKDATKKLEEFVRQDKSWGTYRPHEYKLVTSNIKDFNIAKQFMKEKQFEDLNLPYRFQASDKSLRFEEDEDKEFFMSDEQKNYEKHKQELLLELEKIAKKIKKKMSKKEKEELKEYRKQYQFQKWYTIWDLKEEKDFTQNGHPVVFLNKEEAEEFIKCIESGNIEFDKEEQYITNYEASKAFEVDKNKEYRYFMKQYEQRNIAQEEYI
ncbi:MAG: hypothetical protein NC222_06865 [Staphylococcus sp.]|nr:hypothetical protein [Staphylococcus sp.]